MKDPVLITVEHPRPCLSCGERVVFGAEAWWVKDVGIWHVDCPTPKNLSTYQREAEQKRKLGL